MDGPVVRMVLQDCDSHSHTNICAPGGETQEGYEEAAVQAATHRCSMYNKQVLSPICRAGVEIKRVQALATRRQTAGVTRTPCISLAIPCTCLVYLLSASIDY